MSNLFSDLCECFRDQRGSPTVEFALLLPVLLGLFCCVVEGGNLFVARITLEKNVRAAALYAARNSQPLSAAVIATATNLAETGDPLAAPSAAWSQPGATIAITTQQYSLSGNFVATQVPIVTVTVRLPYQPLMPGLAIAAGLTSIVFSVTHAQPYIGQ